MRTVVCGIGNRIRGDDAAGPLVIDMLRAYPLKGETLVLDCEHFPENFIKTIAEFNPQRLILVDTADFGGGPGDFKRIDLDSVKRDTISTHKMPVTMFISFLKSRINFETVFIGIQPKHTELGKDPSDECRSAAEAVSKKIWELLK